MKTKRFTNPLFITGFVFLILGIAYSLVAIIIQANMEKIKASPNTQGNVEIIPLVFGILALVFIAVALILLLIFRAKKNKIQAIIEQNHYVYAKIIEIKENPFVRINGRHPKICICQHRDEFSGETTEYASESLINLKPDLLGTEVKVYLDPVSKENYIVDSDQLTK